MKSTISNIGDSSQTVDPQHPWLGLKAYTEETQGYFFGRNTAINELFTRVRENRLTTLFGQSGLGKTSLLGAGLLPKLKVEGYRPQMIRLDFSESAPSPTDQTRRALCDILSIKCKKPDASLWELLHHIDSRPKDLQESPPVLIFDQFEEIFTRAGPSHPNVNEWFSQIADLVEHRPPASLQEQFRRDRRQARAYDTAPSPVRIIIALREDYLSPLEHWKSLMPSLMRNRMALYRLTGPEALEAVIGPGSKDKTPIVSPEVGQQIVRKVARRPESIPMEEIEAIPPFLSLLCEQLNAARLKRSSQDEPITSDLVSSLGDNILNNYYEECFVNVPDALRLFVEERLVSPGGHRNTLTIEDAENEMNQAGVQHARQHIDTLIARRLLTAEERNGITRIELTHDLLAPLVLDSRATRREKETKLQARKQRQRQIRVASVLTLLIALFATLAGLGWYYYGQAERSRNEALDAKNEALRTLSRSDFIQGTDYLEKGNERKGLAYLSRAIRTDTTNLSAVVRLYSALLHSTIPVPLSQPMQHDASVWSAAFSSDARFVVTASSDNTARVWDAQTGKPVGQPMQHKRTVRSAAFSSDARFIVTASSDNTAQVWDAQTGKPVGQPMQHDASVRSAAFSSDARFIVTASSDNTAQVWDAQTGKPVGQPMQHDASVRSAAFSSDARFIVTASS
ncbi:MAG: hypothetical protein MI685_08150, partial [Chlorobiales bacterium]|nr:hypothetical protein [Chlorobiales bacterium]